MYHLQLTTTITMTTNNFNNRSWKFIMKLACLPSYVQTLNNRYKPYNSNQIPTKKIRCIKENWLGLHRESGGGKSQSGLRNPNTDSSHELTPTTQGHPFRILNYVCVIIFRVEIRLSDFVNIPQDIPAKDFP